jgi:hypothetical protein
MGVTVPAPFWLQAAEAQEKEQMRLIIRVNNRILVCLIVKFYVVFDRPFFQHDSASGL